MDKATIKTNAEAYIAKGKAYMRSTEGKEAFAKLSAPEKAKISELLSARRGFRKVNGVIEFTKEALEGQISRLEAKKADYSARIPLIDTRVAELKAELAERFGDNK